MTAKLEEELAATAEQVAQRIAMGDQIHTPRAVDHAASVPRSTVTAALEDLRAAGFDITSTQRRLLRATIEFTRPDAVDAPSAAAFTAQIVEIMAKHGGDYDGWSGFVVSPDPDLTESADTNPDGNSDETNKRA